MSIPATEAVTSGMFSSTGAPTSTAGSADKDMFLQLLVAQMRYQDPMNPTDSSQFLAQSAQFTALEKMQAVADQTAALFSAQMAFGASGLIGKQVTWTDKDGVAQSGTVSGVTFGSAGPILDVGDTKLAIADVVSVTDKPATA
ncbi:flagellar hook capping protein [Nocardioides marmoriginsengisoli]|uniref:Flagellar hook capping protein n=1 Tax=Nocardioides marmoriginsengisoli TaxID=661483 RepID=A0A3N0CGR6_9ACTN|nr:flagellar hook capping FlgD N-terminal domain-containing protein [Nocardioides marmoriginsengisoli]RNL62652.1 flagellar hook capping protein [Nocardioides marmoriginsengisoli]